MLLLSTDEEIDQQALNALSSKDTAALHALPRAVEVSIACEDYGTITRLIDLPEVDEAAAVAAAPPGPGLPP